MQKSPHASSVVTTAPGRWSHLPTAGSKTCGLSGSHWSELIIKALSGSVSPLPNLEWSWECTWRGGMCVLKTGNSAREQPRQSQEDRLSRERLLHGHYQEAGFHEPVRHLTTQDQPPFPLDGNVSVLPGYVIHFQINPTVVIYNVLGFIFTASAN